MPALQLDLDTGDLYLEKSIEDPDKDTCNTVQVDNYVGFKQVVDGLLHCIPGSEPLHPEYGFDLRNALRMKGRESNDMSLEAIFVDALSPRKEKLIQSIENLKVDISKRTARVNIHLISIFNDSTQFQSDLDEL